MPRGPKPKIYDPTEPLPNVNHEAFCNELLRTGDRTNAYMRVYNNSNYASCNTSSYNLLKKNKNVRARLNHLLEAQEEPLELRILWNKRKVINTLLKKVDSEIVKDVDQLKAITILNDIMKIQEGNKESVSDKLKQFMDEVMGE